MQRNEIMPRIENGRAWSRLVSHSRLIHSSRTHAKDTSQYNNNDEIAHRWTRSAHSVVLLCNSLCRRRLLLHTMMIRNLIALLFLCCSSCTAWSPPAAASGSTSVSRQSFLQKTTSSAAGLVLSSLLLQPQLAAAADKTLDNGVSYKVLKSGNGAKPTIGDLVALRFAAYAGDIKIDDIFETPEPYYTRLGSGGLIKGVEETLPLMQLGDRWVLTIPVRV